MRLYSIGEMLVNGPKGEVMRTEGVVFWEIARQSKEGYWVRRHGHAKATDFVPMDKIGRCYFLESKEVLKFMRDRLRKAILRSKENTRILEKEYADAKKGLVYTKEWSGKAWSFTSDRVPKKLPKGEPNV